MDRRGSGCVQEAILASYSSGSVFMVEGCWPPSLGIEGTVLGGLQVGFLVATGYFTIQSQDLGLRLNVLVKHRYLHY